jgi:heme/copper-type cytochrome/quinol oxidase subunit 3
MLPVDAEPPMTGLDNVAVKALVFGLISAASLPLGAIAALVWTPRPRVVAALMAFGGGALLAALTLDLVGEAIHRGAFWALAAGCLLGGALFVSVQVFEYLELIHEGSLPKVDIFWSTFYTMTGFHGLHVIVGVIWLIAIWIAAVRGKFTPQNYLRVELAGLYWHFVDIVWIFLFPLLYLIGHH